MNDDQNFNSIYQRFNCKIQMLLPFRNINGAWLRIDKLEQELKEILKQMSDLSDVYKEVVPEPRDVYLTIQEVKSATVYIRWRRKGISGNQRYLTMDSLEGQFFLLQQSSEVRKLYQNFNTLALQLNLAYSFRLNEIKRSKKYIDSYLGAAG